MPKSVCMCILVNIQTHSYYRLVGLLLVNLWVCVYISLILWCLQFRACAIWKRFCPLSPLRGGGVVVHVFGRPFDWGNQVCPPIQMREISERKNGEKTH